MHSVYEQSEKESLVTQQDKTVREGGRKEKGEM